MATLAIYGGHHPGFVTNSTNVASHSLMPQISAHDDQFITTFFCRALYDYQTNDASSLSFHRDDIIEVLTQLESGWWDGLLGDERGWFPSNYVAVISDEEAEAVLSASESSLQNSTSADSIVSSSQGGAMLEQDRQWLEAEIHHATSQSGLLELPNAASQSSDFWMPQVTPDGQIYYVNTQTGQHSRDLPQEADDEVSDGDLAGLTSQSSSRSGTSAGLGLSVPTSEKSESSQENSDPAVGILKRTGTPEPWVKKLADDGMSYYYWNRLHGQIEWTKPGPDGNAARDSTNTQDQIGSQPNHTSTTHPRSESSVLESKKGTNKIGRPLSKYSDDSDIPFFEPERLTSLEQPPSTNGDIVHDAELTSSERLAQSLHQLLTPSPPELITDLSNGARKAIMAVLQNIQLTTSQRQPEDHAMDSLVNAVVLAIRNLLYVSAAPSHVPSNLLSREARDLRDHSASQTLLKPAQRKVTATLSKLVLSARAMQYDSGPSTTNTPNRIEGDAEDLERAIVAFVLAVERCHNQELVQGGRTGLKRLRGVFSTANVGLGLVGAGVAGTWKGFGWVALENDDEAPGRILGTDVLNELGSYLLQVEQQFNTLSLASRNLGGDSDVFAEGRKVITQLSSFLVYLANIHVARHVDIDGILRESENLAENNLYAQTVEKARLLVRTLEAAAQSLYDDGFAFLLAIQDIRHLEMGQPRRGRDGTHEHLDLLAISLKANLRVVHKTLEELLSVGHDQADMSQGDYNGSIEWRMSRMSMIHNQFGGALRLASDTSERPLDLESEDVVDFALAFRPPGSKTQDNGDSSRNVSTLYHSTSMASESTLDHPQDEATLAEVSKSTLVEPDSPDLPSETTAEAETSTLFDEETDPTSSTRPGTRRGDKFRDILGEEAPQHYRNTVNADLKPWYLRPNYSQTDILIDYPDGAVRGGTVPALVERLTAHEHGDPTFIKTFLMTYKSFTSLDELFDLLVQRFWIQPPANLTPPQLAEWRKLKQHVIQMRVLNTFKSMVVDDDVLEKEDIYILDRMKEFISNEEVIRFAAAKQLMIFIERAQRGGDAIKMMATAQQTPPPPIMPKTSKKLKLLDIDSLELARQLTIMESRLYQKIRPMECLQRSREQKGEHNDNIAAVIQTSNRIADWVAESILSKEDARRRAAAVKQFISVADRCRMLHNYSTMVAITSGLNTPPIRRLKRTWEQVNGKFMTQLGACERTIDSNKNFNNYRLTLASVTPPCVPFIGVFLTTLQFIQDGSKDNLSPNIVNFRKRQKASEVIQDIKRWQSQPFTFHPIPAVLTFIDESLNQFNDSIDIRDRFWNLSLEREPREREDEKMARLLQESGFL